MISKEPNNTVKNNPKESLSIILKAMQMKSDFLKSAEIKSEDDVKSIFDVIFYAKRQFRDVLEKNGLEKIRTAFEKLKDKNLSYDQRVEAFSSLKSAEHEDIVDMAKEIIHFLEPEKYPLWTRWIWNPTKNSGSATYILKDNISLKTEEDYFNAISELKEVLSVFGLDTGNYYPTSIFLVYAYVRYVDYATLLAVDRRGGGLYPSHLSTTAMVLGLKPFLKVIQLAHS
ncbi:MAG: hypothetical protein RRA45_06355 [Saccharolobus sp.]|jgi:hypothetical protein|uniref:hypothetical protein n=1 Tax=Saccharolobus sp. TaxID=2100761 RepID=UPI0028CFA9EC|nr:hypothetical protein [Saccharolobus sp.]MDT7861817.1 hypothetical protein [Saccharolobus sp.]